MARKMSEDFIGTCQWCFGEYKVNARREVVLHGYQRPGIGYTLGNCQGVGHAPFDDAHALTDIRIKNLREDIAKNDRQIAMIDSGKVTKLPNPSFLDANAKERNDRFYRPRPEHDVQFLTPQDSNFAYYLKVMRANLESENRHIDGIAVFLEQAVAAWSKKPIVGLDSPATGRERYVRDAYDPEKAKDAEVAAQRKAERDAKPGKITINFYRLVSFPQRGAGLSDDEWRAGIEASHAAEKAFRAEVKNWGNARFPGKVWVGDGDNGEIRHITGRDAWSQPEGKMEVVAIKPEWKYVEEVMAMFPSAHRLDKDTQRRDPVTKQGIGKGKDIRIWVDASTLP